MLTLLSLVACAPSELDPPADGEAPTWNADVAPIVEARCSGCHKPGGVGLDLTSADQAVAMASAMASAVEERRMPPWGAFETEDCTPTRGWVDDRRLSEDEIATIVAWADAGAPLGEGEESIEPAVTDALDGEVLDVQPPSAYASVGREDEFSCFVADPGNIDDLWLSGIHLVPSNDAIAHHALIYAADAATADALGGEDGWYDCSQGVQLSGETFLATWVPGSGPTYAPEGTGLKIEGGSKLVVQMHYHPGGRAGEEDLPTVHLAQLAERPRQELHNTLLGNAWSEATGLLPGPNEDRVEFKIPANVAGHTEEMRATLDGVFPNLPLPHIGAHMHLIGTSLEVWIERATPDAGEPERECLLGAGRYQYDWQQLYRYEGDLDEMPAVSGGDSVVMRCTYDNTLENAGTRRALDYAGLDEPVDVSLGEGTLDEMCIMMVGFVY